MSKKVFEGTVIKNCSNKTVSVLVERRLLHKKYKKIIKRNKKYLAHDEKNISKTGDKVKIIECRPISKRKKWQLLTNN